MLNRFIFLATESIKNPKKFFYVLYKRLFSIPTLEFLRNLKYKKVKHFYLNFWYYFSKKNKNFKKICFDEDELKNKYRFTFNKDNFLSKEISDSLSYNGIVVIENVLGTESLKTLRSIIDQLNYNFDKSINNLNQKKSSKKN